MRTEEAGLRTGFLQSASELTQSGFLRVTGLDSAACAVVVPTTVVILVRFPYLAN